MILASWYSSEYKVNEVMNNLIKIMKKYGDKWKGKYCIYRKICKNVAFLVSGSKVFKVLINKTKNLKLNIFM